MALPATIRGGRGLALKTRLSAISGSPLGRKVLGLGR
jgi:hypothetical protein